MRLNWQDQVLEKKNPENWFHPVFGVSYSFSGAHTSCDSLIKLETPLILQRAYKPSILSNDAIFKQTQNSSMASSSSLTGGYVGASRILRSRGSL